MYITSFILNVWNALKIQQVLVLTAKKHGQQLNIYRAFQKASSGKEDSHLLEIISQFRGVEKPIYFTLAKGGMILLPLTTNFQFGVMIFFT